MGFVGSLFKSPKTNVVFPGRSPEETALLQEQTAILRQQQQQLQESLRQQNLLQPLLFGQLGIREVRDAAGNVTGYERAPLTPEQQQQAQIESKLRERTLAALEGNLPVDPALERSIEEGRGTLGETLRRNLGPGFETSTPGIQALAEFGKRAEELRFGARTGTLTTAEALAGAREARKLQREGQTFGQAFNLAGQDLPFIQTGTGIGSSFSGPLSNMLKDRELLAQTRAASVQAALKKYDIQLKESLDLAGTLFGGLFGGG